MKTGGKTKPTVIHRIRKRVHTTVSPETHEYLKNTALNVGKLLDNTVSELRTVTPHNMILISEKKEEQWTRRDLNPRPLRCERSDLPLIYEPKDRRSEYDLDV